MPEMVRSFHDRIDPCLALQAMMETYGRMQRFMLREHERGRKWTGDLAVSHYAGFGVTAKSWEHCWRDLQGRIASQRECDALETAKLERRIVAKRKAVLKAGKRLAEAREVVAKQRVLLEKAREAAASGRKPRGRPYDKIAADEAQATIRKTRFALHQHRRKLASLEHGLKRAAKPRSLCLGGRKLFNAQHHLAANGHADHAGWKLDWLTARSSQFLAEGDAAHPGGNQFVRLHVMENGTFDVELRVPDGLAHLAETHGRIKGRFIQSVWFRSLTFRHGRDELLRALEEQRPISWRFLRDGDAWRVVAMVRISYAEPRGSRDAFSCGALGVDLNVGHVAVTQVDRFGNPVNVWRFDLPDNGLTEAQRLDACRKVAARIARLAKDLDLPVVSEDLDFTAKKSALRDTAGRRRVRMLSSFAYARFDAALTSACTRLSVRHRRVNPAFTSVIGDVSYSARYGLSVHAAAALVIARRAMRLSERLPAEPQILRRRHRDHVALPRPVRNGPSSEEAKGRHVWSDWGKVAKTRRSALAGPVGPDRKVRPSAGIGGRPIPSAGPRSGGGVTPPSCAEVEVLRAAGT